MEPSLPSRTRRGSRLSIALLAALVLGGAFPGHVGAEAKDPSAKRKQVQEGRAKKAAEVNVLEASDDELEGALDAADAAIRTEEAQVASAAQAATAAAQATATARENEARTAAKLGRLQSAMRRVAVDSYVRGPTQSVVLALEADSFSEAAAKQQMLDIAMGSGADLSDELRATREDLGTQRAAAEQAQQRADKRAKELEARLVGLTQSRQSKQQMADSVEARLEQALAEADSLAAIDKQLAGEIARRQAALAVRVATSVRAAGGGSPSRGVSVGGLTTVRGIVVATEIAGRVEALLAAAQADGFALSGNGYRSSDGQSAARRANCGGDVYGRPASQCRPPTARPGQSMHERGLAIDFTWNGGLISGRGNAAFQWLSRNAGRFGLSNLPREPWHWSTNGN